MENLTDSQLIAAYKDGNSQAFDTIVYRYTQVIYRFCLKLLNNKDEAHDITQETIIKIWKNIKKYDEKRSFKTWIFTIAQRTALDFLRKRKNVSFSALDEESDLSFTETIPDTELLPNEAFEKDENIFLIQNVFEKISLDAKMIVLLRNGEEMTFEEIALVLDRPMNTVKSQYRRALQTMKKEIINMTAPKLQ